MSRHRNVRNLDIDDVMDEDEYEDDYGDEFDETQISNEDADALEEGVAYVQSVVGDVPIPTIEIKEALWYYYFDREETINWVMEKVSKIKAEEEKQKKKEAKKVAAAKDVTRKTRFRRPPARLYSDELEERRSSMPQVATAPSSAPTSLSRLSGAKQPASNLASLRAKMQSPPTTRAPFTASSQASDESAKKPTSSLRSLAQQSAGQRGKSALQSLAARKATTATGTSLSSAPSNTKAPSTGRSSLASLAQRSTTGAASEVNKPRLASLSSLQSKQQSRPQPQILASNSTSNLTKPSPVASTIPLTTKNVAKDEEPKEGLQLEKSQPMESEPAAPIPLKNPLCAPPSAAANFLFVPSRLDQCPSDHPTVSPVSLDQALYEAMRTSAHAVKIFPFDIPSPDDVVFNAQSHRSGGKLAKS